MMSDIGIRDKLLVNYSSLVSVGAASQLLIQWGEQSGLQTHIATTERVSLRACG